MARIGFFGDQRVEKGSLLIPKIATLSIDAGLEVVVHDSANKIDKDACGSGVLHLGLIKNLASEISKCDLVVLPYDPTRYQYRGSAVLLESAASGTPVLAPLGTGMASNIANGVCA
jgi:glycosyltransferase involved in cell wall biosynthesis